MFRITQQQLESYLWGAATLLRGHIDAGDYKQFIFPLLFFKRLSDVYDEEFEKALKYSGGDADYATFGENHRFQVPSGAHWRDVRNQPKNIGKAIQDAMREIEKANPDQLFGIFGDAQWTNTDRLPDAMLKDLVEHFSSLTLSIVNVPEDELGVSYEFLIKKFADDSGHTAAEFYTNRTLVHLMTLMLDPQPRESIYDPTCGSGGMLLSCVSELKRHGKEYRTLKLYGQELNLMTSSIARMNMFLHGIEDFKVVRGDALAAPAFTDGDALRQFDVVLANPPYSIKQWDRTAWSSDRYGRNFLGTPPQGRADYAFFGHILASLKPKSGRCAILFPHGVLFRDEEQEMRAKLIDLDQIECVLGLGPNLFTGHFPFKEMVSLGWITDAKPGFQRVQCLLQYLGIASTEQWESFSLQIQGAYRQSASFKSDPYALGCWLRQGELQAQKIDCQPFSEAGFRRALQQARTLTTQNPDRAGMALRKICAEAGVASVVVPEVKGTHVSGVTRWLSPSKALIQQSLRHKTDDHFWFTFFHEAGHILLHGKKAVFLEMNGVDDPRESEANAFASKELIPKAEWESFLASGSPTKATIRAVASKLGIAPGIEVGRLQHEKRISHSYLNDLKTKCDPHPVDKENQIKTTAEDR